MNLKIKDRLIGALTSMIVALITFLFFNYFSSFVTMAQYNNDKLLLQKGETEKEIVITGIKKDLEYIKEKIDIIYKKTK